MKSASRLFIDGISARSLKSKVDRGFYDDVLKGLSKKQKTIPSKYFYDEAGSQLFDQICALDEYYPTRTEMKIMEENIDDLVDCIGRQVLLVEYGSGSSLKTRILLDNLKELAGYVPIDISKDHLLQTAENLKSDFPHIQILPVHADYTSAVNLLESENPFKKKVVYFPGSTIGNFTPEASVAFLKKVAQLCDQGGGLLIGVDMKKDTSILEAAYNDAKGVTAAFNLNLLVRMNRELLANFAVNNFEHKAIYNEQVGRIEMHLISKIDQEACISGKRFAFVKGETIHTENSYKYGLDEFAALALEAGLQVRRVWTDSENLFSVQYLTVV